MYYIRTRICSFCLFFPPSLCPFFLVLHFCFFLFAEGGEGKEIKEKVWCNVRTVFSFEHWIINRTCQRNEKTLLIREWKEASRRIIGKMRGRKRGWGEVEHEKMLGGKLNQLRDPGLRGFSFFFLSFLYLFFVHRLALLLPLPSPHHPHGKRLLLFF